MPDEWVTFIVDKELDIGRVIDSGVTVFAGNFEDTMAYVAQHYFGLDAEETTP